MDEKEADVDKIPVTTNQVIEVSESFSEKTNRLKGVLPDEMLEFFNGETPIYQRYEQEGYLDPEIKEQAEDYLNEYRVDSADEVLDRWRRQKIIAEIMTVEIRLGKYDSWYFMNHIKEVKEAERLLPHPKNLYLEYIVYRYRKQIRDQIIYEEKGTDKLQSILGRDLRQNLNDFIESCKESYDKVNNRYDVN